MFDDLSMNDVDLLFDQHEEDEANYRDATYTHHTGPIETLIACLFILGAGVLVFTVLLVVLGTFFPDIIN